MSEPTQEQKREIIQTEELRRVQPVKERVEAVWAVGNELETTATSKAIERFRDALNEAEATRREHDDWTQEELTALDAIIGQAQSRYDEIRWRHEIPVTKQEGQIIYVILDFVTLLNKEPEAQVTYFANEEPMAEPRLMMVAEAINVARARLVKFWENKVDEYLDTAKMYLSQHKPRQADTAIGNCEKLPGRYDKRLGVPFPAYLERRIADLQKKIEPALEELQAAETALARAKTHLDSDDPLQAYQQWRQAEETYPHVEELAEVRQQIKVAAWQEMESVTATIQENLEAEAWQPAQQELASAAQFLDAAGSAANPQQRELRKRITTLQDVYDQAKPVIESRDNGLHGEEERRHLEMLKQQYRDSYWPHWSGLQARLEQLRARQDVSALQKEVGDACNKETLTQTLAQLKADVAQIVQNPPPGLAREDKKVLQKSLARLESWLGFAQARDEWRKVKTTETVEADEPLELTAVPDLAVMQQGIEAAQKDRDAANAARNLSLADRLGSLVYNDEGARKAIGEARRTLDKNRTAAESLTRQKKEIERWLRRPTSCRRELLAIYNEVSRRLCAVLQQQMEAQIDDARPWFEALDVEAVNRMRHTYEQTAKLLPAGPDEAFLQEVDTAAVAASAHRAGREAEKGMIGWEQVKKQWETARDKAPMAGELRDYAHRRSRSAFKHYQLREARAIATNRPEGAERLLRQLIEDPVLQADWEVWYAHGEQTFHLMRRTLNPKHHPLPEVAVASNYLEQSRLSLNRAQATADGQVISAQTVNKQQTLDGFLANLGTWERLIEALDFVIETLAPEGMITHEDAHQAVAKIAEAQAAIPQGSDPARWLVQHWRKIREAARDRLEKQFEETADVFVQLDSLLAIIALFPDEETVQTRLQDLVLTVLSDVQREVGNIVEDDAAAKFLERYRRKHNGNTPENRQIVQLQLDEVAQASRKVRTLRLALDMKQLETVSISSASLSQEEEALSDWQEALRKLQIGLDTAKRIAQNGLRRPQQFGRARYILRQGNAGSVDLPRVPENFKNRNHPSYRECLEAIQKLEQRRQAQKELHEKIVNGLRREQETAASVLMVREEGETLSPEDEEKMKNLHQLLQDLKAKIAAMHEAEPDDPTGLQMNITYEVIDENRGYYRGLHNIGEVINRKLEQHKLLKRWLERFTIGQPSSDGRYPGVADWEQEKVEIFRQRDGGPAGLVEANKQTRVVRDGDEESFYHSFWSLTKTHTALAYSAMTAHLREKMEAEKMNVADEFPLYSVCQLLNQRRIELRAQLARQIEESETVEEDIRWRRGVFKERWQKFIDAQQALMRARKLPWQQWIDTGEWETFRQATRDFCGVCPAYPEFRQAIQEVTEKTGGLEASCDG